MSRVQRFFYHLRWRFILKMTGFNPGVYIQDFNHIHIGRNCHFGPNCAIIAVNHDPLNLPYHREWRDVWIEDECWIGACAVILPGVRLGRNTVVGAGSVVTKSWPEGHCVLVGNPARKIRDVWDGNEK